MKPTYKLSSNGKSKIGTLPSASKDVSVKFIDQCIHILNNKDTLNVLKVSTKMKIYKITIQISITYIKNVQSDCDVNHRGMKMR